MLRGKNLLFLFSTIFFLLIAGVVFFLYSEQKKIGYVDNERVMAEYKAFVEGKSSLEQRKNQYTSNLDTLENEINIDIKEFQMNFSKMTLKEKELTETLISKKKQNYFNYKKAVEEKQDEEEQKIISQIINQIDTYIYDFGEKNKYDFIIGMTDSGNLLYAKKNADITDEIITGLNRKYEGN